MWASARQRRPAACSGRPARGRPGSAPAGRRCCGRGTPAGSAEAGSIQWQSSSTSRIGCRRRDVAQAVEQEGLARSPSRVCGSSGAISALSGRGTFRTGASRDARCVGVGDAPRDPLHELRSAAPRSEATRPGPGVPPDRAPDQVAGGRAVGPGRAAENLEPLPPSPISTTSATRRDFPIPASPVTTEDLAGARAHPLDELAVRATSASRPTSGRRSASSAAARAAPALRAPPRRPTGPVLPLTASGASRS